MLLVDLMRRDKRARFWLAWRQEGLPNALRQTRRYLRMRLAGAGLSGLFRSAEQPPEPGGQYLDQIWQELAEQDAFHMPTPPQVHRGRRQIVMIGDLNLPQCRKYRVEQPAELWRQVSDGRSTGGKTSVGYDYAHYQDLPRACTLLQQATHVMLYRLASGPAVSTLLYEARRLRLPVLYDLDDPLFSISAYATYNNMAALPAAQKQHFVRAAPRYLEVMAAADVISVSTPALQDHSRLYCPRPVVLRRNFADAETLRAGEQARAAVAIGGGVDRFRVGFASGSAGHEMDFATIADDVIAFLAGGAGRQLVILGHFDLRHLPDALQGQVECHPFTDYAGYMAVLASLDLALMPLADDLFNRCKSAVRVIDAAAVAVPSVVGHVSDMAQQVIDGATGHVITAGASWLPVLEALADDPGRCRNMGRAAQQHLQQNWSARCTLPVMDPELLDWVLQ